ncbi:MAG: DNA internalization-related competence protein ComEC/Rec2 [Methylococcales bacterium]|nr:DNA internalization-related competence protein ComEC/Rec2 [Methylococcales bacterium]
MIGYALAFTAGDLLLQQFSQLPSLFALLILSGIAAIMARLRYRYLLFFILGFLVASAFSYYQLSDRLSTELEGLPLTVTGKISNLPDQNSRRANFELNVLESAEKLPLKLKLSWYEPTEILHVGETWQFTVKLKRPHTTFNDGGMDYERWLFSQNIGATGTVGTKNSPPIKIKDAELSIDVLRQKISDKFTARYGENLNTALVRALTVGDDNGLSFQNWDTFRITGVTHLIVISGSHIALVAGLVYFLTLQIWTRLGILRFSPPRAAALASLITAIFYALLAGYVIPTKRAVIMLGFVAIASFYQRHFSPLQSFAIALFAMLIFNPTTLLSIGFWLSFLAVALILYRVAGRLKSPPNWKNAVDIQLAVSLGLSPLLLFFFNQTSLISPLVNFVVVPIVELLVVPLALLQIPFMWLLPWFADKIFVVLDFILQWLMQGFEFASTLPNAMLDLPQPSFFTLILSSLGVLWLFTPRGIPARFLGLVLNLPLLFPVLPTLQNGEAIVTILDVGQGLAVSVQTQNHGLLYDTGARFFNGGDMGKSVVLPFFRYHGIKKLDTLLISHGDNDHSGGAYSVLEKIPITQILTSAPEKLIPYQTSRCETRQHWTWDGVQFSILSPAKTFEKDNDNSCVLRIETGKNAILLTGDIESVTENWLVENMPEKLPANVLVAPHHGSKTSSSLPFLQAVKPKIVLIPAGYRNQFHHPSKEIVARYKSLNAQIFTSANDGALEVKLNSNGVTIESLRETAGKYWQFKE